MPTLPTLGRGLAVVFALLLSALGVRQGLDRLSAGRDAADPAPLIRPASEATGAVEVAEAPRHAARRTAVIHPAVIVAQAPRGERPVPSLLLGSARGARAPDGGAVRS